MSTPDLHQLGVAELAAKLAARDVSSTEVTRHLLARARQHGSLGAYLAFNDDAALAQARAAVRRPLSALARPRPPVRGAGAARGR